MAVDDFLTKYYARYANKSSAPTLISSRNNTSTAVSPVENTTSSGYGSTLQANLGSQQNSAAQSYNTKRAGSNAVVAQDLINKSAGNTQTNEYGIVTKPASTFASTAKLNLSAINNRGEIALQGAQDKAQWQQLKKLQDLNNNYNVSTVFGAGYDPSYIAAGASSNNPGAQALAIAMTAYKNGTHYVWGGNSLTSGVDCSGLVQQAYKKLGIKLPRTTYEQAKSGQVINVKSALPGDLMFYNTGRKDPNGIGTYGHVAIYMGNGQILEAANSKAGIRISSINGYNGSPALVVRPWS